MQKYGLSHGEEAVLSALRYVSKDGMWIGSYSALSRLACFVSRKTLYRTVYRLVDMGLILIEENGYKTVFVISQKSGQNDTESGQNDTASGQNDTASGQNVQERKKKNQKEIKKEEKNNIYIFNQNKDKGKNIETAAGNFEIKINKPSGVNEVAEYCRSHAKLFNMEACKEYYYYNEGRGWKGVTDWHYDFAYHYNKIRRRIEREQARQLP